jgi:triosephosphate isomerase (TIM)
LNVILCVGETLEEREAGNTAAVVESQLVEVIKVLGKDDAKWG